ncbi:MAG TPA: biopolymer transporter ExbD [Methylomirabilota bacterium]|nr:biopolymer transporter ExbD [Methylomirabilota bacterium]
MRFPRNKQIFRGQLDIAAFTGVLFILLIFVLMHSQLIFTPGVPISLPEAEDLPGIVGNTVVVAIDASGQYYFENQLTHERLLRRRLSEVVTASREPVTLVIEADKAVTWDDLKKLALLARKAGVKNALGATRPSLSATNRAPSLPE